ncbi:MAG: STAS domain-containing protein [Simkania sp.]|nr:STAS domain-containing protein [Simkania sp.]
MNLVLEEKNGHAILRLEGRVDATSAPLLEEKIDELTHKGNTKLLIDFTQVEYLSSAGIRFLLAATKRYKSSGGMLVISSVGDDVMEIIKMAGFEKILRIFSNEEKALKALVA